jgi:succinate-acetate transporter protein
MLLSAIVLGTAVGLGIGALIGATAVLAIAGGLVGLIAGFALVYTSFKNI